MTTFQRIMRFVCELVTALTVLLVLFLTLGVAFSGLR